MEINDNKLLNKKNENKMEIKIRYVKTRTSFR